MNFIHPFLSLFIPSFLFSRNHKNVFVHNTVEEVDSDPVTEEQGAQIIVLHTESDTWINDT